MPSREAYQRCPQGIFVPPNMALYAAVSHQVMAIFDRFTPLVEPVSIDEAFLDVTGSRSLFGAPDAMATQIRDAIRTETGGLTASVGVAGNKFLAKLAGDLHKPDGQTVVPRARAEVLAFLAPLPVGRLWGVGKVLRELLTQHNFRTIGDVQRATEPELAALVGRHTAGHLLRLAFGEDERDIATESEERSISREHTFPVDCRDPEQVRTALKDLADDVGHRLREAGRFAGVGRIKLRWSSFQTLTRQHAFPVPACDDFSLRSLALELLAAEPLNQPVRLIGFGVTHLVSERRQQLTLFDDPSPRRERNERLCRTVDRLCEKLGNGRVVRASSVERPKPCRRAQAPGASAVP